MRRRPQTLAAAATCSLLLSQCALPALANHADLFFDFSSKIRVGTTSSSGGGTAPDESSSDIHTTPSDAATLLSEVASELDETQGVPPEMAQALAELEELFAEIMAELESEDGLLGDDPTFAAVDYNDAFNMTITTESLLSLSAQVPANASAAEWISAYGDLLSKEQRGYYNAEGSGYTT